MTLERVLTPLSCNTSIVGTTPFSEIVNIVQQSVQWQLQAHCTSIQEPDLSILNEKVNAVARNADVVRAYRTKKLVLQLHHEIEELSMANVYPSSLKSAPWLSFHTDMVTTSRGWDPPVTLPYEFLLVVLDKMESQFLAFLYSSIASTTPHHENLPYHDHFMKIYHLLDQAVTETGTRSSKFFKMLEPLSVGVVLQALPPETNDHLFLDTLVASLKEEDDDISPFVRLFIQYQQGVIEEHGERAIPMVLEMYGQEKMHFYPIVDSELGLVKMYRYGTAVRKINSSVIKELVGQFNKEWIIGKYEQDGVLVPIIPSSEYHPYIQQMLISGNPQSLDEANKVPLREWSKVLFRSHCEFNYFPDVLDLLDDKGISPRLSKINQLYAPDALKSLGRVPVKNPDRTRLVLEMLDRSTIDVKTYFEIIEENGIIPSEESVIQLKAKERENKIVPREFSILTFTCRMCASTCERNIADAILPVFSTHSMSSTGSELKHTIDRLVTLSEDSNGLWVTFHLDLEQWNYTFRAELVAPFLGVLNDIFGVNHYMLAIRLFSQSVLVSANKYLPPGTPNTFTHWNNHSGGNQGIFQKLWTLITIMIIRRKMILNGWRHYMIGAGDNQVVAVWVSKTSDIGGTVRRIKTELTQGFQDAGLTLKLEETWHSQFLLAYQRKYHFRSNPVANAVKITVRAFAGQSDMNSGLNSTISTSMNAGVAISEVTSDPLIGIVCAYVETFTALLNTPRLSKLRSLSRAKLSLLAMVGTEFGYLPFLQLPQFSYSGHKDPLSDSLGLIKVMWDNNPHLRPMINSLVQLRQGDINEESDILLVTDPGSLNIKKPSSAEGIMREAVECFLKDPFSVKNQSLQILFKQLDKTVQSTLARELLTIRPIHLSLVAALFQYSEVGHVMSVVNRFNKISSIVKLVNSRRIEQEERDFQSRILAADRTNARHFSELLNCTVPTRSSFEEQVVGNAFPLFARFCTDHNLSLACAFSLRLFLVSYTFGKYPLLLIGPFIPPSSEQLVSFSSRYDISYPHSIAVKPALSTPRDWRARESTRGPFSLLIGSKTKDPVRNIRLVNLEGVTSGKAIQVLMKVFAWLTSIGSDLTLLREVRQMIDKRAPDIGKLLTSLSAGTAGGTFTHRFDLPGSVMGCYSNSGSLVSTWFQLSTNHAADIQRGTEDRFIFFQEAFQKIISVLRLTHYRDATMYVNIRFDCCSYIIQDDAFVATSPNLNLTHSATIGAALPVEVSNRLATEAHHYLQLQVSSPLDGVPPEDALAAYLAHQLCKSLRSYSYGVISPDQLMTATGGPQATYNISVMRKVNLCSLLISVAFNMALYDNVSRRGNLEGVIHTLKILCGTYSTLQDVAPYRPFLEAIIVSGKLAELSNLAGAAVKWETKGNHIVLLPILLKAIINVCYQQLRVRQKVCIIMELRKSSANWNSLWRFLGSNSARFRKWHKHHENWSPTLKVQYFNSTSSVLTVLLTPDADLILEYGRRSVGVHQDVRGGLCIAGPVTGVSPMVVQPPLPLVWDELVDPSSLLSSKPGIEEFLLLLKSRFSPLAKLNMLASRWNSVSSGARLKMIEIMYQRNWNLDNVTLIVAVAEGAGSYLSALLHLFPTATGVYNSLIAPEDLSHAYSGNFIPPELICPHGVVERVCNLPYSPNVRGDLRKAETWDEIRTDVATSNPETTLLTWDMENIQEGREDAFNNLFAFLNLFHTKRCIIKLFLEDFCSSLATIISEIASLYGSVRLMKPAMSNLLSSECFLLLKDHEGSKSEVTLIPHAIEMESWRTLVEQRTPSISWHQVMQLAIWTRMLSLCPNNFPSTRSSYGPRQHPLLECLYKHIRLIATLIDYKLVSEVPLSRGFQHMLESKALGSRRTSNILRGELMVVGLFLKLVRDNLSLGHSADFVKSILMGGEHVKVWVMEINSEISDELLKTHVMRLLGEVISCPVFPNSLEMSYVLNRLITRTRLLPDVWSIKSLVLSKLSSLELTSAISQLCYPTELIHSLDGLSIKWVVEDWMSLILSSTGNPSWMGVFEPLMIKFWFIESYPNIDVCDGSPQVMFFGDGAIYNESYIDNTMFDAVIVWTYQKVKVDIAHMHLISRRHSSHDKDKLYLSLWVSSSLKTLLNAVD